MRKKLMIVLSILLVGTMLVACAAPAADDVTPPAPADTAPADDAQTPADDDDADDAPADTGDAASLVGFLDGFTEEVTLNVNMMWSYGNMQDAKGYAVTNAIARLNAEFPNLTINYNAAMHDDYGTAMLTLMAANDLPDLFNVRGHWIGGLVDSNQIGSVAQFEALDPDWYNSFIDATLFDMTYNGQLWGIPFQLITTSLIIYNQEIFGSVGFDQFPQTWEDMIEAFTLLQEAGYVPLGVGNRGQWVANSVVFGPLGFNGAGPGWFHDIMSGTGDGFLDEGLINGVSRMHELAANGFFNDNINSIDMFEVIPPYVNRQVAAYVDGSWGFSSLISAAGDDQSILDASSVAVFPPFPGGAGQTPAASIGSGWGQAFSSRLNTPAEEFAAFLFIRETTGWEWGNDLHNMGDASAVDYPWDFSGSAAVVQRYNELLPSLTAAPLYDVHFHPAIVEAMNTNFQLLLIDEITPEEWAQRVQDVWTVMN